MSIRFHCKSVKTESDFLSKQQIVIVEEPNESEILPYIDTYLLKEYLESFGWTVTEPQEDAA